MIPFGTQKGANGPFWYTEGAQWSLLVHRRGPMVPFGTQMVPFGTQMIPFRTQNWCRQGLISKAHGP